MFCMTIGPCGLSASFCGCVAVDVPLLGTALEIAVYSPVSTAHPKEVLAMRPRDGSLTPFTRAEARSEVLPSE
jgi:hypothetical protein